MTREELLGIEGATLHRHDRVAISLRDIEEQDARWPARLLVNLVTNDVIVDEGDDRSDSVYLGRAATVADVERLVAALRGLGR